MLLKIHSDKCHLYERIAEGEEMLAAYAKKGKLAVTGHV
jgi:hypothetical protein